jgi:hypothetical protein
MRYEHAPSKGSLEELSDYQLLKKDSFPWTWLVC